MAMARLATCFPDIDLLREVDLITAVSGGTLPAAYYALSQDPAGWVRARIPGGVDLAASRVELKDRLDAIATNFRLADGDAAAMDQAVAALVSGSNPQLRAVRAAILAGE